jgi:hypothetical protein
MFNVINNSITVAICRNAAEAIESGYMYKDEDEYKPITIHKVVVVQEGTVNKNPTVDFILEDETGQKYVFMITGRLLKSIPCDPVSN